MLAWGRGLGLTPHWVALVTVGALAFGESGDNRRARTRARAHAPPDGMRWDGMDGRWMMPVNGHGAELSPAGLNPKYVFFSLSFLSRVA